MMIRELLDEKMQKVQGNIQKLDDKMDWINEEIR